MQSKRSTFKTCLLQIARVVSVVFGNR